MSTPVETTQARARRPIQSSKPSSRRARITYSALAGFCATIIAISVGPTASADEDSDSSETTRHTKFEFDWADSTDRDSDEEYNQLMARARRFVLRSAESRARADGRDDGYRAADLFARAAALRPDRPEPHYLAAEVLSAWDADQFENRTKQALKHYSEFIRLAPKDPRVPDALFGRSILLTKLGGEKNIRLALRDYAVRLKLHNHLSIDAGERQSIAVVLSNAAELNMYVQELDTAIGLYYDSLEFASGESAILYSYGLAVALDRDGQRVRARQIMKEAARRDRLAQLSKPGVFFIPQGDVNYYRALGFESLGDSKRAAQYYRRFLRVLPKSPYAGLARKNLDSLIAADPAATAPVQRLPKAGPTL